MTDPESVACPYTYCGVPAGFACQLASGKKMAGYHKTRKEAARLKKVNTQEVAV